MALKTKEPGKIKFWTPLRIVSTVIVLGLVAAFGISSCNSNDPPTTTSKPNDPSRPPLPAVALDTEMKGINGESIKLSNYSGKVLLVNLWATWCGPCRNEIPELVRLHKEYQSRGVEMVGLTTEDPVSSAQIVQEFVRNFKVDYQVGWAPREVAAALMQGRGSIPQSLIVTRDGRITKRFVGFHPRETPPLLKKALEEALIDNG
ncbi:MAG: TlpA family protein disulfide reductase [Acidobacteria bacterium]|nr:TlpA family protein disulfide reductase [Acidobacteriota bacterium]